jgi:glycosyltransferase involved in cell wall biosynthesis
MSSDSRQGTNMQPTPDISLIICFHNQQPWARAVLTSAARQRVAARFEVIVCDDGSTDGLFNVVRDVARDEEVDIRYVWQPRNGHRVSRSRNNAMRCAQGRLLVFVDGDTWLGPHLLRAHLDAQAHGSALVCGLRHTIVAATFAELPQPTPHLLEQVGGEVQPEHAHQRAWITSSRPWMACLSGNLSIPAADALPFDEMFESWGSEDRDLAYRVFINGTRPVLLDAPNAIHLTLVERHWSKMPHDAVVAFLHNKQYLARKYPDGEMEPSLALVRHCYFDTATGQWAMSRARGASTCEEVFRTFDAWTASRTSWWRTASNAARRVLAVAPIESRRI